MAAHAAIAKLDAAVVRLPPASPSLNPATVGLIALLLILAAGAVIATISAGQGALGHPSAPLIVGGLAIGAAAIVCARVFLRGRADLRRRRELLERLEAGSANAANDEVAAAVLATAGCRLGAPLTLRRAAVEAWELRLRRTLPRVCIVDDGSAAKLRNVVRSSEPPVFPEPGTAHLHAATVGGLAGDAARQVVLGAVGVAVVGGVSLVLVRAGWARPGSLFFANMILGAFLPSVIYSVFRRARRRAGWWLALCPERARLVRLRRDGTELDRWDLDLRDTLVVLGDASKRKGPNGDALGEVAWRFVPPAPAPAFDAFDLDPRATPWSTAVARALT